jgi:hypothetical protein
VKNQRGFISSGTVVVLLIVAAIAAIGLYIWHSDRTGKSTGSLSALNQDSSDGSSFSGKVVFDQCAIAHSPDAGCSLAVGNKSVQIVPGNIAYPDGWGSLEGFGALQDITGERVQVHAKKIGPNTYDLAGRQYYVKLLK